MKYNFLKSIAVLAAFLVGVAINHSCGESMTDDSVLPAMEEMWSIVRSLRTEVSTLKEQVAQLNSEVAALKSTGGGSSGNSDCGEFFVDGLYFSRNGIVSSKYKRVNGQDYYYDNQGRVSKTESYDNNSSSITTFEYSGKTEIRTTTITYDSTTYPDREPSSFSIVYEYY